MPRTEKARVELCVVLPDTADECDACLKRLQGLLGERPEVALTHVKPAAGGKGPELCLHYDPDGVALPQLERWITAAGAEVESRYGHASFSLRALDGEDAARRIERVLTGLDGVTNASVNLAAQRARVEFDRTRVGPEALQATLEKMGYLATALPAREPVAPSWFRRHQELTLSLTAGGLLLAGWAGNSWLGLGPSAATGLYAAAYVFGAWDIARHTVGSWREGRFTFDIDLLMLLAAVGAAVLGEWAEGAFLLFLFSLAHSLEHAALDRARGAIRALAELAPPMARVVRDGREVEVPVEQVAVGEVAVVRPGERIPVDGEVQSGRTTVNQAPVTGESVPVEKSHGDPVFAGTVNGEGALTIVATRAAGDRTLDRVIALVEEAQTQKAPTQRFTDRFESIFVPTVLVVDLLLIVVPPMLGIWDLATSFYRGMALLVASSPCALALGTPAAVLAGIAQAARNGVLIKGGAHLENLGRLKAMALDKTGTLTVGEPKVTAAAPAEGVEESELLEVAAAVESRSQHPLAKAVVTFAKERGVEPLVAGELESVTGRGVRAKVGKHVAEVGSLRLWEERELPVPAAIRAAVLELQVQGKSVMAVRHGDRWLGALGLADAPRPGVQRVLERLRQLRIRPLVMLTGDNREVGRAIGQRVGVDEVYADLMPEDKVEGIKRLLREHGHVAMVGDGVNDAPALAHATVGIAMGGAGTAVALETADVALMADDLGKLPFAVGLSRRARTVIRQNLYFSLIVVLVLILGTVTGVLGIGPAVFVHEGSTLVVIANALRLLAYREPSATSLAEA